jgi:carboxylesterase
MLPPSLLAFASLAAAVGLALRARRTALRVGQTAARRLSIGPDGIVVGAEAIELLNGPASPALLLLHGGGDTPQTLRYLADHLHSGGYTVRVPLLPGHGRTLEHFARVNADDWLTAARVAYREMRSRHAWVGIVGLSMGGALAVQLAAEQRDLPALALLAPYLAMPRRVRFAARCAPLWGVVVPYVRSLHPRARRSISDPAEDARNLAYGVFTAAALRALHLTVTRGFASLPFVTAPTLMIQSREYNRTTPAQAQRVFDRLGAREKTLVWIEGASHVITVDYGHERVFETLTHWLEARRTADRGTVRA